MCLADREMTTAGQLTQPPTGATVALLGLFLVVTSSAVWLRYLLYRRRSRTTLDARIDRAVALGMTLLGCAGVVVGLLMLLLTSHG